MVKKKVGGSHRYKALAQASKAAEEEQQAGPKPPQHLQRKITKKVKFFEKVAQSSTAAALQVERGVKKKQRKAKAKQLPNLQSLAGELEQLAQGAQQEKQRPGKGIRSSIKRSKARLAITLTETQRLQAVLQHPMYKADPIQAITNHLTSTLPAAPVPKQQKQQQQGTKSKRSKKKGGGGGVADMQS